MARLVCGCSTLATLSVNHHKMSSFQRILKNGIAYPCFIFTQTYMCDSQKEMSGALQNIGPQCVVRTPTDQTE